MNRTAVWLRRWYKKYVTYLTVTPLLVAVTIIGASLIVGLLIHRNVQTLKSQAIEKQLKENQLLIENRFESYAQVIWGGAARLNSGPVDREAWRQFVETMQLAKRYPALYSMGVTKIIPAGEESALIDQLSVQYSHPIQISGHRSGMMNLTMYSQPERSTTLNNMGFNIYSDETRRSAAQKAIDTNDIAMTEQIQLITNARQGESADDPAFLIYAPYYRPGLPLDTTERRRVAVQGHVSGSFRTQAVFARTFESLDLNHLAIQVYMGDKGAGHLAYESRPPRPPASAIHRLQTVTVFGQQFTIHYEFDGDQLVAPAQLRSPLFMVVLGLLIGLLMGTITFFFLRGRHHQLQLDKERDVARAKDELLSLASHQLRTPATGVKQYLGMVLQGFAGPLKARQEELLEKAYKSNERQLHTINDILHLAKLDLGRIVLAKTDFNLSDLVKDVLDEQRQDVEAAGLTLNTRLIKRSSIHADQHMLRMVIENLLSNAVKYTDAGGQIWVRLARDENGYLLSVKDTGVGIDADDAQYLFKQFSRIMNSRSHLVTGTGVGLYLSKNLMVLHGGDIGVESVPGKGSTFTVYIPDGQKKL